jgi:hypothetical protein
MTALNSGLHFLSGIALHIGATPAWKDAKSNERKAKRRRNKTGDRYTPLTERQKKELLDSIRDDDWFE